MSQRLFNCPRGQWKFRAYSNGRKFLGETITSLTASHFMRYRKSKYFKLHLKI